MKHKYILQQSLDIGSNDMYMQLYTSVEVDTIMQVPQK